MRALWFVGGAAAGIYVAVRARRAAETLTAEGLGDRLSGWSAGARVLRDELLTGMAEKEADLRARIAEDPAGAEVGAERAPAALDNGSRQRPPRRTLVTETVPEPAHDPRAQAGHIQGKQG